MTQLDLLDRIAQYPSTAGFKEDSTSRIAASRMDKSPFKEWSHRAICELLATGPMTVKEAVADLLLLHPVEMQGRDLNSIRPRFSELKALCRITESGERRAGQHVYQLASNH
jgi:hypothetical protein